MGVGIGLAISHVSWYYSFPLLFLLLNINILKEFFFFLNNKLVNVSRAASNVLHNSLLGPWIKIGVLYVFQSAKTETRVYFKKKR